MWFGNPETGRIAGHLTFVNPQSLAGLASSLPSIAGGAAMQLQLARIEKALDGLKQDLAYLIRHEHLKVESCIEANLKILGDVYSTSRRRETVEDDSGTASPTSSTWFEPPSRDGEAPTNLGGSA